ncbi:MAG: polysaccharide deacetylase family protein, partial [Anaerolineales bacterium]
MKHPGRLLIYWDYELQRGADVSPSGRHDWGIEDFRQTEKLLELLDQYQVKTTFAVVGFAALDGELPYHAPAQIREIARRGHEVASHTWMHDWVPGLTYIQLLETLRKSKEQLEVVTGQPVISFAPPWNAPRTFLQRTSIGLYDRRRNGRPHTDIPTLCRALRETGYQTARIAYEPLHHMLLRRLTGKAVKLPTQEEWIEGIL